MIQQLGRSWTKGGCSWLLMNQQQKETLQQLHCTAVACWAFRNISLTCRCHLLVTIYLNRKDVANLQFTLQVVEQGIRAGDGKGAQGGGGPGTWQEYPTRSKEPTGS